MDGRIEGSNIGYTIGGLNPGDQVHVWYYSFDTTFNVALEGASLSGQNTYGHNVTLPDTSFQPKVGFGWDLSTVATGTSVSGTITGGNGNLHGMQIHVPPVPEPATAVSLLCGLGIMPGLRRRRA